MPIEPFSVSVRLKTLGFTVGNQMRLYGEKFEVAGEPIVLTENVVLVDAIEVKTGKVKRLRIPLPILKMAGGRAA